MTRHRGIVLGWPLGAGGGQAPVLSITGTPLTAGTVGIPYSFQVQAFGGVLPYVYGVSVGTLPSGVTLNSSTGLVSGTPTTVQTRTGIVIRVVDGASNVVGLPPFDVTINPAIVNGQLDYSVPDNAVIGISVGAY